MVALLSRKGLDILSSADILSKLLDLFCRAFEIDLLNKNTFLANCFEMRCEFFKARINDVGNVQRN